MSLRPLAGAWLRPVGLGALAAIPTLLPGRVFEIDTLVEFTGSACSGSRSSARSSGVARASPSGARSATRSAAARAQSSTSAHRRRYPFGLNVR